MPCIIEDEHNAWWTSKYKEIIYTFLFEFPYPGAEIKC